MKNDPLVEKARAVGQKYIDSFKGDWKAIIADLECRARKEGRTIVTRSPRTPAPHSKPVKKAG